MQIAAARFKPARNSSVSVVSHNGPSTWLCWFLYHVLVRVSIFFRMRRSRKLGIGNLVPPGPQDYIELFETYKTGKNRYAAKNDVRLDWYTPASEPEFSSSRYFDWSTTRALRYQPKASTSIKRVVVYFNGGGFVNPATAAHSYICAVLAHRLDAVVYMFPYELAPTGIAASQLPKLTDFYLKVAAKARKQGHEVIVAGDSAGGSISSCLALSIKSFAPMLLDEDLSEQDIEQLQPDHLILISAVLTCNNTKEVKDLAEPIQPEDWWLSIPLIDDLCKLWIGTPALQDAAIQHFVSKSPTSAVADGWRKTLPLSLDHPIVDCIGASESFELLKKAGVTVTLLCGTADTLFAYSHLFAQQCEKYQVQCTFIEGVGGIHVYPILGFVFENAGSSEAIDLIVSHVLRASSA